MERLLQSIENQNIPERQVVIVGDYEGAIPANIHFVSRPDLSARAAICEARNIGINASDGDPVILLDDDVEFPSGWYEDTKDRLARPFDLLTCRVSLPTGERWYDWNWASRKDPVCPTRMLDYAEKDRNVYISGCMMIIGQHVLEKVRFNETLANHQRDDVDFCHRVADAGFDIDIVTNAYVIHHLEPAGRSESDPAAGSDHFSRGVYLYRLKRHEEALTIFRLLAVEDKVKAPYHAALCLMGLGRSPEAEKELNLVAETADKKDMVEKRLYYSAHYHLGSLLEDEGRLDEAVSCYRRTLEGLPEHHEAAMGVVRLLKNGAEK